MLTRKEVLSVIVSFIKMYCNETGSNDAKIILNNLQKNEHSTASDNSAINLGYYLSCARMLILKQYKKNSFEFTDELFSEQEAFEAMILVLEEYYSKTNSDDLGAFLGDLLHAEYGETADDAAWEKWQECLENIKHR